MKKTRLALLAFTLFLITLTGTAQIPNGYYDNANGLDGAALKTALHNIIKNHKTVSYNGLLNAFVYTDSDSNGKVWDIYSNYHFSFNNNCGSYDEEGDCWNREHTWPQSWFNEATTPRCDLFHVYPTDGYVNGQRSNYPYGEVNNPTYTSGNGSKLGPCVTQGYSGKVFEPIDEYKGDIARGFFYMSVRYLGEDDSWSTSGMTNKSEILPWAMTMLLRWSDEDPVSDKEIARNNAVYNYQKNRNPFIDHPEYARMIWDPNYTPATLYDIAYASNLTNGSITGPENAYEGTTVAINAIPAPGYMVGSYTVYNTEDPNTTLPVSSNGTFTMPGCNVTVSATFQVNNTYYAISTTEVTHGTISVSASSAKSGSTITMEANPEEGYSLYSWYVYKTGDMNTVVYNGTNGSFTMPAFDVTVLATFSTQGSSTNGDFIKVTENLNDWSGEYLIVYEGGNVAFDGGRSTLDAATNTINVTINDNTITADQNTLAARFTIAPTTNGYTIQSISGYYIGKAGDSNGIDASQTTSYVNTLSYNDGNIDIVGTKGAHLRYNDANNQKRFRYYQSTTYTGQKAIQLYKRAATTPAPTHTIHFYPNGATGSSYEQNVEEFVPAALIPNTFLREGFVFDGWNTEANGEGTFYADEASITLTNDIDLYAQWEPLYAITIEQPEHGTITSNPEAAIEEATITLTATPDTGYELNAWIVTDILGNTLQVVDHQFSMPASNVTVTASFEYVGQTFTKQYYQVTSTDQLVAGRTYLIVNEQYNKALGTTQNNNNRAAEAVTVTNDVIATINDNVCELTLGGQEGAWTFYDALKDGYLYAAGATSNNYLRTQTTLTDAGKWTITISEGNATIKTIDENVGRHTIMYNNGNTLFSCYASGQQPVQLFIRAEEYLHATDETLAHLFPFDKHTVRNGATLTVNGNAACDDASLLVIEDGGQLIHHSNGVKATFKKTIYAYTEKGGWYTIAIPFTYGNPEEIATNDYDLYAYDEDAELEWVNYKNQGFNSLEDGQGYLYAHNPTTTLRMTGTLNNGDLQQTVDLSYGNTTDDLKGFNLLGNPTAHAITFEKTSEVSDGYYYLDNNETWTYNLSDNVPAGRGFLVKANTTGQTVTMNLQSKRSNDKESETIPSITIDVDGEQAFVKLSEGVGMPTASFNNKRSSVYLSHEGKSFIMLPKDNDDPIDLHYQPSREGQHQLQVNIHDAELPYLHLIDRLTGNDIDLIAQPTYAFHSGANDYAGRFQLCFKKSSENTHDLFAYLSDGQLIVNGEGTLQIFDVLGHQFLSKQLSTANCQLPTAPGVYILRLITPEKIKTQEIVVPN